MMSDALREEEEEEEEDNNDISYDDDDDDAEWESASEADEHTTIDRRDYNEINHNKEEERSTKEEQYNFKPQCGNSLAPERVERKKRKKSIGQKSRKAPRQSHPSDEARHHHKLNLESLVEGALQVSSSSWDDLMFAYVTAFLNDEKEDLLQDFSSQSLGIYLDYYLKSSNVDLALSVAHISTRYKLLELIFRWFRSVFALSPTDSVAPSCAFPGHTRAPPGHSKGSGSSDIPGSIFLNEVQQQQLLPTSLALVLQSNHPVPPPSSSSSSPRPCQSRQLRLGSPLQLCLLFHTILLSLGFQARLVFSLDPHFSVTPEKRNKKNSAKKARAEYARKFDDVTCVDSDIDDINDEDEDNDKSIINSSSPAAHYQQVSLPVFAWVEVSLQVSENVSVESPLSDPDTAVIDLSTEHCFVKLTSTSPSPAAGNNNFLSVSAEKSRERRWINVDPLRNIFNDKIVLEQKYRARQSSVAYIIALTSSNVTEALYSYPSGTREGATSVNRAAAVAGTGCVVEDVTLSYSSNPSRTRKKRIKHPDDLKWWKDYLERLSQFCATDQKLDDKSTSRDDNDNNNNSVRRSVEDVLDLLPTSVTGFKHHPTYVLKSQLLRNQILSSAPGVRPLGVFAGQPIYYRKHVVDLKSSYEWLKSSRVVREHELPLLYMKAKSYDKKIVGSPDQPEGNKSVGGGDTNNAQGVGLFAEWQTDDRPRPQLVNGEIPRNAFGNIEIWGGSLSCVPEGAAYISSRQALTAAKELGIPFVEALVGFQEKFNYSLLQTQKVPILNGIVVLQEYAELIEEAAISIEKNISLLHKQKKWKHICEKWHRLVWSATLRCELRQVYGN